MKIMIVIVIEKLLNFLEQKKYNFMECWLAPSLEDGTTSIPLNRLKIAWVVSLPTDGLEGLSNSGISLLPQGHSIN